MTYYIVGEVTTSICEGFEPAHWDFVKADDGRYALSEDGLMRSLEVGGRVEAVWLAVTLYPNNPDPRLRKPRAPVGIFTHQAS